MIRTALLTAALVFAAVMFFFALGFALSDAAGASTGPYLADATRAPSELSLLKPGRSVTYAHGVEGWNCPHKSWFTDVQAYTWSGAPFARQRNEIDAHQRIRWGRVTFDGITFHNGSRRNVLVAGWCS